VLESQDPEEQEFAYSQEDLNVGATGETGPAGTSGDAEGDDERTWGLMNELLCTLIEAKDMIPASGYSAHQGMKQSLGIELF